MDRRAALTSLLQFDVPLTDLEASLSALGWDSPEGDVVTLTRKHISDVLERWAAGEIDAATVEEWANLIEMRPGIEDEPGHEETVLAAIHDLANPYLQGSLDKIAPEVMAGLRDPASP